MDRNGGRGAEFCRSRAIRCWCSAALLFAALAALFILPGALRADEIQLKDGNKLYGVIVAYEDNMFKVRTPFGYVLVEKDKIAAIVPSPAVDSKANQKATAKKDAAATVKHSAPANTAPSAP